MSISGATSISTITTAHQPRQTHRLTNGTQACAACKHQRRKCTPDCILAPYFPHERQSQFLNAHRLFGVGNITKIIKDMSPPEKDMAMRTIIFQSDARAKDPVGGCSRIIQWLEYQVEWHRRELKLVQHQLALCKAHQASYQQQMQITANHDNDNNNKNNNNNDDPTTSGYKILQEYNDQQQGFPDNSGEVLDHRHHQPRHDQDFQSAWDLQDSDMPLEGGFSVNFGHEPMDVSEFGKSEMMLKAENIAMEGDEAAFQDKENKAFHPLQSILSNQRPNCTPKEAQTS